MATQWKGEAGYLFVTLQMGFEIRKAPPESGWKWLYLRTEMTVCQNGRYGMDVTIFDETGDVVVMSRHVSIQLSLPPFADDQLRINFQRRLSCWFP